MKLRIFGTVFSCRCIFSAVVFPRHPMTGFVFQVAVDCRRSCFECLGNIFTLLPWQPIMQFYCSNEPREIVSRLHVCLFTLLVRLGSEKVIVEVSHKSLSFLPENADCLNLSEACHKLWSFNMHKTWYCSL